MKISFTAISLTLFAPISIANDRIIFKQKFSPHHGWLNYGMAILVLLTITWVLAKKYKPKTMLSDGCQLIEKKHIGNKTIIYIIDYQQQRFLLADNQQALTIHQLITPIGPNTPPVVPSVARELLVTSEVKNELV